MYLRQVLLSVGVPYLVWRGAGKPKTAAALVILVLLALLFSRGAQHGNRCNDIYRQPMAALTLESLPGVSTQTGPART
jgi:hypothetical protein